MIDRLSSAPVYHRTDGHTEGDAKCQVLRDVVQRRAQSDANRGAKSDEHAET